MMDLFEATFWVTMLVGLLAVLVPAYWLASESWQDRDRPDDLSAASPSPDPT